MLRSAFRIYERLVEGLVLLLVHRTVDVVIIAVIISRCGKGIVHINAVARDNGSGRVEEMERCSAELLDFLRQRVRHERARSDYHRVRVLADLRQVEDLLAVNNYIFAALNLIRHHLRELLAVNRQRAARRDGTLFRAAHAHGIKACHLLLHEACGRIHALRLEGI